MIKLLIAILILLALLLFVSIIGVLTIATAIDNIPALMKGYNDDESL